MTDPAPLAEPGALYDPLVPVPAAQRALTGADAFALWFSLGIGLLVLQSGALLAPGLSLVAAAAAIVIGSACGAALLGAAAVIGADTGLSAMAGLRPALGVRGAAIPAALNALQLVGWGAFELIAMGATADALCASTFGVSSAPAWTVAFGALATWLAIMGPVSFVRRFLRRYGVWLVLGGAGWLSWQLLARHDLIALFRKPGNGTLTLAGGIDLVIAMPVSWLPLIADYTRFGKTPGGMFKGSGLGYLIANIWFYALGALYAASGGGGDALLATALAAAGGGVSLLLIIIDETDNAFADIFSAAASTASLVKAPVARLSLFYGALSTGIALFVPLGAFQNFLYLIGSIFAPLFAVLIIDHFVRRRRRLDAGAIDARGGAYWHWGGFRIAGLVAWAVGIGVYQSVSAYAPALGATLPSIAAAALAYLALGAAADPRR
jgi:NCS1 family nucleobase:cation symporter-1